MEKKCSKCGKNKDLTNFGFRNKAAGKRCNICCECQREYVRRHYQKKKEQYKARAKRNRQQLKAINRANVLQYYKEHPCVDCGETDPIVLTFDHVRGKKIAPVSKLLLSRPWEVVFAEIQKCEVRCSNCHTRRTAKQMKWFTALPL